MTSKRPLALLAVLLSASLAASGCSTVGKLNPFKKGSAHNKVVASAGKRISIIAFNEKLEVSDTLKGVDFYLPEPQPVTSWSLPGGTLEQSVEHVAAGKDFEIAWKRGFGEKSKRGKHVTAPPVAADGKIFVMDAEATVSALDASGGEKVWRTDTAPRNKRDKEAFGGGLAYADGKLFVSSGYRFVAALDGRTGSVLWRTPTDAPIHAAPTVAGGKVYVAGTNDELLTFDAATGAPSWTYQALAEQARILEASSPAVSGEVVVVSFASGELTALQRANGNDLWTEALSRASRTNALSEIRDIPGRPVIYKGDVFAVSHSGVFANTDLRTGTAKWSLPVTGISSPWAAGDVVYVVDVSGQVICVARESGQVYWIKDLNAGENLSKRKQKKIKRTVWSGPVLASGRLVLVSSRGEAVALNPKTGAVEKTLKLGSAALITPMALGGMLYVATDEAELIAIR